MQEQDRDADGIGVAAGGLSLNGGTIADAAGNPADLSLAAAAIGSGHAVNGGAKTQTKPTRAAVTSAPRSGGTYGRGESVDVEVQFNKEVTVAGQPQLELTIGSNPPGASRSGRGTASQTGTAPKRLANFVSGANERLHFRYVVGAADDSLGGRITIAADALRLNGASITDAAGEPVAALQLDGAEVVHGDPVDGGVSEPAMAERVAVTSAPQDGRTYRLGEAIVVEIRFSSEVAVSGAPQLELAIDGTGTTATAARRANFVAADGDTLVFRYPIQAGDNDSDEIGIPANALHPNGGTIVDLLREPAELGLEHAQLIIPAHRVDGQTTDATPPVVASVAIVSRPPAGSYVHGDRISVAVTFSEPVTVAGSPQLALHVGSASRMASITGEAGAMSDTIEFVYTVRAGDRDADGIAVPADALRLAGGTIRDGAGNDAVLRSSAVQTAAGQTVDPAVRIGCRPPNMAARGESRIETRHSVAALQNYDLKLALELDENRDGSERPVQIGCVALAAADRHFSYAISAGNDEERFAVGAADGLLSYVGRGEDAERTPEYLLTITASPHDGSAPLALQVRVAVVDLNDPGAVTLSTAQPRVGEQVTARLTDQDGRVRDERWQWRRRQVPEGEWRDIAQATARTYTVVAADAGHYLQARVTYADEHGVQRAASAPTEAVDLDPDRRQRMLQLSLAGFGRAVATSAVEVIGRRFGPGPADADAWRVDATLNRRALQFSAMDGATAGTFARNVVEALGVYVNGRGAVGFAPVSGDQVLAASAFSVERSHGAGRWGFWGGGDLGGFGREVEGYDQDGSVLSGYLGTDYRFVANALAGLAASYSNLDLTSESEIDGDANLKGYLINAYPYVFWMPSEWLDVWGLAGLGAGEAELADAGATRTGGISMWLGAIGQRTDLLSGDGLSLALKGDGFFTGVASGDGLPATEAHAWRARVLLEGGMEWRSGDSRLAGTIAMGGRLDGGHAENGFGAEGAAELSYLHAGSGLGASGRGRLLLLHEDQGIHDWGASVILSWAPPGPGSGLALSVGPQWGEAATGVPSLWREPAALLAEGSGNRAGERSAWLPDTVELKVSYALDLAEGAGRLAPFAEIGFEEATARRVRFGLGGSLEY